MGAQDNRQPNVQRTTRVTVTITILRDSGPPRFMNTPYEVRVPINRAVDSVVSFVEATDADLRVADLFFFINLRVIDIFIVFITG